MSKPTLRRRHRSIRIAEAPKLRITTDEILADLHYPAPAGAPAAKTGAKRR